MDCGVMMGLPIGFRFRPTDEELVVYYLRRKALSLPLPAPVIHHFDVFLSHPNSFPGDSKEKRRFYFCKGGKGMINLTATGCGFWKTNGNVKQIVVSSCDGRIHVLGTRTLWAFYQKSGPHGWARTPWVMHQFQLPQPPTQVLLGGEKKQEWGVCRVFQRKKKANKQGFVVASTMPKNICNGGGFELPAYIDFKMEEDSTDFGPPEPYSPSSSTAEVVASGTSTGTTSGKELAEEEQLTSQASSN